MDESDYLNRAARARLDGTQMAVVFLAYALGSWRMVGLAILVMFLWAAVSYALTKMISTWGLNRRRKRVKDWIRGL